MKEKIKLKRKPNKKEIFADYVAQCLVKNYADAADRIMIAALNMGMVRYTGNAYELALKK